jgi:hypothetical protein
MNRIVGGSVFLLLGTTLVVAEDRGQDRPTSTPEQQYKALLKEYNDAYQDYSRAFREAATPQDRQKIVHEKYPKPDKYAAKILRLAEKHPKAPFAEEALIWILSSEYQSWRFRPWYEHQARYEQIWVATSGGRQFGVPSKEEQDIRGKAIDLLLRDHVASEKLGRVVEMLGANQDKKSDALVRAILDKNPSKEVKAEAAVALACQMQARLAAVKQLKEGPQLAKSLEQINGKDYVLELQKADPVKLEAEANNFYAELVEKYLPDMNPALIAVLCQRMYYTNGSEMLLRALYTRDKRAEVRGVACLVLGQVLMHNTDSLAAGDVKADKMRKESEKLLEEAADRYADVKTAFDGTVGRRARSELFDLRHLLIGKPAPEIEGIDQDSKRFKLSDYKGKVVLLDFWSEF